MYNAMFVRESKDHELASNRRTAYISIQGKSEYLRRRI